MAVIDADNSDIAAGNQPLLDIGIVLHRAMAIEVIGRQVEQDAGGRIERRRKIDLVGGAFDDEIALALRRIERQHGRADIAAELRVAAARSQDMGDQRRRRRFAVGAGDGDEGAIGRMRPALAHEELDVADDIDAGRTREIDGPVRLRMGRAARRAKARRATARSSRSCAGRRYVMPSDAALATLSGLSSQAVTSAPPAISALAVAEPEPPRPKRATFFPASVVTGIMTASPQLQGGKAEHGKADGDDPEADHHLALGPALLFEMVVDRRHEEDAPAGHLEEADLDDDRRAFL